MNFLYSSDENYAPISMVSISSLLENNQNVDEIVIYYIDAGVSERSKQKIKEIVQLFNRKIVYIDATAIDVSFIKKTSYAIAGYYRLLVADYIDGDKIIYLDCDTVVNSSLIELWNIDMQDCPLAAVRDTVQRYVASSVGVKNNENYINSGVIVINLEYWRKYDIGEQVRFWFNQFNGKVPHHDQGVVNGVFAGQIKYLPPVYNTMSQFFIYSRDQILKLYGMKSFYSQGDLNECTKSPKIIHFLNKFYGRPWEQNCMHPMRTLFEKYANKYDIEIIKKNSSVSKKIRLRKNLYEKTPFAVYLVYEKMMDIKRYIVFKKMYGGSR